MNDKITFPRLSTMLADQSGRSKRFSEDFLREFFSLITECLEKGDSVKIKGLGTFRLSRVEPRRSVDVTTGQPMEISSHSKVVFVPSKDLADSVNAPFEAFSAVEIQDDADISQLFAKEDIELEGSLDKTTEAIEEIHKDPDTPKEESDADKSEPNEASEPDKEMSGTSCIAQKEEEDCTSCVDQEDNKEDPSSEQYASEEPADNVDCETSEDIGMLPTRRGRLRKTLLITSVAAVIALLATLAVWYFYTTGIAKVTDKNDGKEVVAKNNQASKGRQTDTGNVSQVTEAETDTIQTGDVADVPTAASDIPVYDTIGTTRYLTTMARTHYGDFNFWPYIYEENKDKLGHPDRIRPGTPVVIPRLSKYGVDPTNSEDLEKAKKMGKEIYARFGKKI